MKKRYLLLLLALCLLAGCGQEGGQTEAQDGPYIDAVEMGEIALEDEASALSDAAPPAVPDLLLPEASGTAVKQEGDVSIDYSNVTDGYVMVQYAAPNSKRMKVQVAGPTTTYTYDLAPQTWVTYPLSDGNGTYKVTAFENIQASEYSTLAAVSFPVEMEDEFAPFIRPNQHVDYANAPQSIQKAAELTAGIEDPLQKVEVIYNFVVNTLSYDTEKAASVKSDYLPVLDEVLSTKKGICFDYAALMTGMLRSQGVPCKLVKGYAGEVYHAWISVWTEETGWIDGAIFFNGTSWQRLDPTFASTGKGNEDVMNYIGDGSHYSSKFLY